MEYSDDMRDGILVVDKPAGMTSFDVIRKLRTILGIRKMGHAGTLDPMATGLLILGVGKGTKELASLIKMDKTYEAKILLGVGTDTGDIEGKVVSESDVREISDESIANAVQELVGTHTIPVPAYSAIKRNGQPLYKSARKGIEIELPVREMRVYESVLSSIQNKDDTSKIVSVTFSVASGVYIRSLAEELGRKLGVPACLCALRRTIVGNYTLADVVHFPGLG